MDNNMNLSIVQVGDFVEITFPDFPRNTDLFAVRLVNLSNSDVNEIIIYPLRNQDKEYRLFKEYDQVQNHKRNGQWRLLDNFENEHLFQIKLIPSSKYDNCWKDPNHVDTNNFYEEILIGRQMLTLEEINYTFENLSQYGITPPQFIKLLQYLFKDSELDPADKLLHSSDQAEWLLQHELFPKTYLIGGILFLNNFDLFKKINQVSEPVDHHPHDTETNVYKGIVDWEHLKNEEPGKFLIDPIKYGLYLAEIGVEPNDNTLDYLLRDTLFNPIIITLIINGTIEKIGISIDELEMMIDDDNIELKHFLNENRINKVKSSNKR